MMEGRVVGGRYRVVERLGSGGMASVFRVRDASTGEDLALKLMSAELSSTRAELRFRREFHTLAGLTHPRIVDVFEYGIDELGPFYTMELLDGRDARSLGAVTPARVCELLRDVASALAFLHARSLVHRDLGPRNVRCTTDGRAKLFDFGILCTFGVTDDVAGTPPFAASEMIRGLPLDHRADIYGLGALAYFMLTGTNAYPVKTFEQLIERWSVAPKPPSELVDCPAALDELVMSMISLDPLARPSSAAEVIDRLSAIASLEPLDEGEVRRGYLTSSVLVGRRREAKQLTRVVADAMRGHGNAVSIEAASGTGKSRLLRELAFAAQLSGMLVLRADARAARRVPYAITRLIVEEILRAAPDEIDRLAPRDAAVLSSLFPDLPIASSAAAALRSSDPAEQRILVQQALTEWLATLTQRRPIAILIDDLQACDEASASLLAALTHAARERSLVLGFGVRTDEAAVAPAQITAIRARSLRMRLRGLKREAIAELVHATFGAMPGADRLAAWLERASGGMPLHCVELLRHLVERGSVTFANGAWTVVDEIHTREVPEMLTAAMDLRVEALGEEPRRLAELLAVLGASFALDDAVLVANEWDDGSFFAALDELGREEIIQGTVDNLRFRHDGLREALLRALDQDRSIALNRRIGEALFRRGDRNADVGWHLVRGGDAARGADLLLQAGRELFDAQSFADAVPVLEESLRIYRERAVEPDARLELTRMLVVCGALANKDALERHASAALAGYGRLAGILGPSLIARWVGRHVWFATGFTLAWLRWAALRAFRPLPTPATALRTFFFLTGYVTSSFVTSLDRASARQIEALLAPISFGKNRVSYVPYLIVRSLNYAASGQMGSCRADAIRALSILDTDRLTPISAMDRATSRGAALTTLALVGAVQHDPRYTDHVDDLRKLGLRFFEATGQQTRVFFHRLRGEELEALEAATDLDQMMIRLGPAWQLESQQPAMMTLAYATTGDLIGLRRGIEALRQLVARGYGFGPHLELAEGEYHKLRGELSEAKEKLRAALAHDWADNRVMPQTASAALAEALLAGGEVEEAITAARHGAELGNDPDSGSPPDRIRNLRVLGLALGAAGREHEATEALDRALDEAAPRMSPLLSGVVHEAAARVALARGDLALYEKHRRSAERWFRGTRSPVLVARAERLEAMGRRRIEAGAPPATGDELFAVDTVTTMVSGVLSLHVCRSAAERAARALALLVEQADATGGFLFLSHGDELELVAPRSGDEPPSSLHATVRDLAHMGTGRGAKSEDGTSGFRFVRLPIGDHGGLAGVAALVSSRPLDERVAQLAQAIGRALARAGDVSDSRSDATTTDDDGSSTLAS